MTANDEDYRTKNGDDHENRKYTYTLEESLHLKQKVSGVNLVDLSEVLAQHGIQKGKDSLGKMFEDRCLEVNQPMYSRTGFGTSAQAMMPALEVSDKGYCVTKNTQDLSDDKKLAKTVNGILNKLTPEKYDALSRQLTDPDTMITSNTKYMELTIQQIFDRAVVQPNFCEMYADLSRLISKSELSLQTKLKGPGQGVTSVFRRLLVETVQKEYNKHKKKGNKDGAEGTEEKKRKLGNIQFVGELYRKSMLTDKVMHLIIAEILYGSLKAISNETTFAPEPGDLEVLCKLLNTTGKELDAKTAEHANSDYPHLNVYFERLEQLTTVTQQTRIKMLILNLCDRRKDGWPDCHKEAKAKKILDLERENAVKEQRKLDGIRNQVFTGDKTAWGQAAELHVSLSKTGSGTDLAGLPRQGSGNMNGVKKEGKKKDDWQTAGGQQKGKKASPTHVGTPSKQPTGGVFASLNSPTKKKKKAAAVDSETLREAVLLELMDVEGNISLKVKSRALECMEENDADRAGVVESDVKEFEAAGWGYSDVRLLIVHEVMRGVAVGRVGEERDALVAYLQTLVKLGIVTEELVVEGVAAFLATSCNARLVEEVPNSYSRLVTSLRMLLPSSLGHLFTSTFTYTYTIFSTIPQAELLIDTPSELYEELFSSLWVPLHTPAGGTTPLSAVFTSACVGGRWVKTSESTFLLADAVRHMMEHNGVAADQVQKFVEEKQGESEKSVGMNRGRKKREKKSCRCEDPKKCSRRFVHSAEQRRRT